MPFVKVNGARLCYEAVGTGEHTIIFIHGGNGGMLSSIAGIGDLVGQPDADNSTPMSFSGEETM